MIICFTIETRVEINCVCGGKSPAYGHCVVDACVGSMSTIAVLFSAQQYNFQQIENVVCCCSLCALRVCRSLRPTKKVAVRTCGAPNVNANRIFNQTTCANSNSSHALRCIPYCVKIFVLAVARRRSYKTKVVSMFVCDNLFSMSVAAAEGACN